MYVQSKKNGEKNHYSFIQIHVRTAYTYISLLHRLSHIQKIQQNKMVVQFIKRGCSFAVVCMAA